MDTFMDKLAQKLTAQEIIKANSAADTEELKRLRGQIQQYNDCLTQMQEVNQELRTVNDQLGRLVSEEITPEIHRLVESGVLKLEDAKIDTTEINNLVQESCAKIAEVTGESSAKIAEVTGESSAKFRELTQESSAMLREITDASNVKIQDIADQSGVKLQDIADKSDAKLQAVVDASDAKLQAVVDAGDAKLQSVVDTSNVKMQELVGESASQIQKMASESTSQMQKMVSESTAQLQKLVSENTSQLQKIVGESTSQLQKIADKSSQKLNEVQQKGMGMDELQQALGEKAEASNEYIHRECVKVYRNVQAVVVEEVGKQTESLTETTSAMKSKLDITLKLAAGALACSAISLVLQLLSVLGIM